MKKRGSALPQPPFWEALQGLLFLLSDPRARGEGIPISEAIRLLGLDNEAELKSWLTRLGDAVPEKAEAGTYFDVNLEGARVRVDWGPKLPGPPRLTIREIASLLAVLDQLRRPTAQNPIFEHIDSLREKLLDAVSEGVREPAETLSDRVRIQPEGTERESILGLLQQAFYERRVVDLEYYSHTKDEVWRRPVKICLLMQHLGQWYAVPDTEKPLRVDRARHARLTEERFEHPADFDPDEYRLKVMFRGKSEHEVLIRTSRGTCSRRTGNPRGFREWVRACEGKVAIESPESERQEMIEEVLAIRAMYD